jgi:AraC family cel operon transcriptional repressor
MPAPVTNACLIFRGYRVFFAQSSSFNTGFCDILMCMAVDRRHLCDFVRDAECFHVARCGISGENTVMHDHDFAEIFWVEAGQSVHRTETGERSLGSGDIVLIRPWDRHRYEPATTLTFVNLAFSVAHLTDIRTRYFSGCDDFYGWNQDEPAYISSTAMSRWIRYRTEQLLRGPRRRQELDVFLIEFFTLLYGNGFTEQAAHEPSWFSVFVDMLAEPALLRSSVRDIAQRLGLSPEHLARVLRRNCGVTAIEMLTRARVDYARSELEHTNRPILDISLDCGYESLSHFYRVFRSRTGSTPRDFRTFRQRANSRLST